nr:molybdate ABC transporter substrate-binding protein [Lysobacter sp. CAU 1642]
MAGVASNFAAPMQALARAFEARSGHRVSVALGSSGALYAQVRHGAPFAVLLSADAEIPERLEVEGLAVPGTRFTYARGRLALWSADPRRLIADGEALRSGDFLRLAIANPRHAPYGMAAREVLDALDIELGREQTLVQGESIAQAYQFVASGNAELGFVALSQVWLDGSLRSGSAWIVPETLHAPIEQQVVLLNAGAGQPAARDLLAFLAGDEAQAIIARYGYGRAP